MAADSRIAMFGSTQLLVLLGSFSTRSCLTSLMMLFVSGGVPRAFLAPWLLACSPLGSPRVMIVVVPDMEVAAIVEALRQHLGGTHDYALHCLRAAPTCGVVACTYHHWFRPFSKHRRYCQLPVSGRRIQRFLQFRLGSHRLPIVVGRFAGGQHVARADKVCTHCDRVLQTNCT